MARNSPTPGPYSRSLRHGVAGASIDGRSAEGRLVRDLRTQLVAHVGGQPTITQSLLIERLCQATLQAWRLDAKLLADGGTDLDRRTSDGLATRITRLASALGFAPVARPAPTLAEHLARRAAEAAAGGRAA